MLQRLIAPNGFTRLAALLVFLVLLIALPTSAAQPPRPQPAPDPQQVLDGVKNEVSPLNNQGTTGLDNYVEKAIRDLHGKVQQGVAKLKSQKQDAKRKADDAAKAAEAARDAASVCKTDNDKKKVEALVKTAEQKQKDAQTSKDKAEQMSKDLSKEVDDAGKNVDKHIDDLKSNLEKARDAKLQQFKDQGLPDNAFPRTNFEGQYNQAMDRLNKAVNKVKQEGTRDQKGNYDPTNEGMRTKLDSEAVKSREAIRKLGAKTDKDAEALDPTKPLNEADTFIKSAKKYLENCPPQVGALPSREPTEVFVAVDNRPEVVACISAGQNATDAANAIGMGNHDVVASDDTGTIIKGKGDPQTVAKNAQDKKITMCFPPEPDFCSIYTPLTGFRGHDHAKHLHSGKGIHEHEAPDPPLTWGRNPPRTVIRWGR